jgi:SAM-dependent methyltransferase
MAQPNQYDTIGRGYAAFRRSDPHIAQQIWSAIGDATRIVNVGAGTGSYERPDRQLVAVEPSQVMVGQREPTSAPVIRAAAEALPFADQAFDVGMAMMTVHHWADLQAGLAELRRVSARQVVFTFDPDMHDALWVFTEYVTASLGFAEAAPLEAVTDALGSCRVEIVPTPADCTDGFASAYWRRPEQYLSPSVRAGISAFAQLDATEIDPGMARLAEDLATGSWQERHADLLQLDAIDAGLRLVISD